MSDVMTIGVVFLIIVGLVFGAGPFMFLCSCAFILWLKDKDYRRWNKEGGKPNKTAKK